MDKPPPLFIVRPKFDQPLAVIEAVIVGIVGSGLLVFFGATFLFVVMQLIGLGGLVSISTLFSLFLVLGLAGLPPLYFEMKKSAWARTAYHFHADDLEYQDFKLLLIRRRGRVRLRDITNVYERATPLQTRRVLTSVYLVIPGMSDLIARGVGGIRIPDVPENAGLREKISDLLEDSAHRRYAAPTTTTAV